jgi:LPS-assembly protein
LLLALAVSASPVIAFSQATQESVVTATSALPVPPTSVSSAPATSVSPVPATSVSPARRADDRCEDPNTAVPRVGGVAIGAPTPLRLLKPAAAKETTTITAEESSGENEKFLEAKGNVEMRSPSREVLSDYVYYDIPIDTIRAKGNVSIRSWQDLVTGPELEYKRDTETGFMKSPKFVLGLYKGRGAAEELLFTGPDQYRVIRGTYSTCNDPSPWWRLDVGTLDVNEQTGVGTAKDARIYIGGVPLAWLPQFTFPLKNERKSGFLAPTYATSEARGFELQLPYYLNLAPNYDATFTPRFMTKRGVMLNSQFRYIVATPLGIGSGEWVNEYLPSDRAANRTREAWNLKHTQLFTPNLTLQLAFNRVSDPRYFIDLADFVSITSITTLPREATLTYRNLGWTFAARAQQFQTLQDPAFFSLPPYDRLPQLTAESPVYKLGPDKRTELQTTTEATRFQYPNASNPSGYRAYNMSSLTYRYEQPGYFITPQFSLHSSRYELTGTFDDFSDSTRVVPIASLDGGLYFDRNTSLFGTAYRQTLEPRAMFTHIPYRDQSQTPRFDTALADFNYSQLFTENRYVGHDRIGDTSQLSIGITSRWLDANTQKERLRFTLGNRIYFKPQRVVLDNEPARVANSSDVLLSAQGRVTDNLYLESNVQYNTNDGRNERLSFGLRYSPDRNRTLNLNYRSIRGLTGQLTDPIRVKQIDMSAQWPIYRNIYGVGRFNYSLADRRLTEGVIGVEFDGCCYVVRAVAQRLATSSTTSTTAFFLQLELNGLARVGTSPLDILKRNIPGYNVLYENPTRRRIDNSDTPTFTPWNPNN